MYQMAMCGLLAEYPYDKEHGENSGRKEALADDRFDSLVVPIGKCGLLCRRI